MGLALNNIIHYLVLKSFRTLATMLVFCECVTKTCLHVEEGRRGGWLEESYLTAILRLIIKEDEF